MAINLDKESIKETDLDSLGSHSTENEEIKVTSESLKDTTQIHGWLSFFCSKWVSAALSVQLVQL